MRVLIIEDDPTLSATLKKGFERNSYAVDCIYDGKTAMTRISLYRNEYDIIILDLGLPEVGGETICKEIRKRGISTPVLILTGENDTAKKIDLLNIGADDYLPKPFSFEELLARMNSLLRRPHAALMPTLHVGDIRIDTPSRTVTIREEVVPCTLKEYSFMEYFLRNPNRVLTRDEILEHVWDFHYDGFSNVVDVYIKNIRKKLKEHGSAAAIKTVRGVGYQLVIP